MNSLLFRQVFQQVSLVRSVNFLSTRLSSSSSSVNNQNSSDSSTVDPQFKKKIDAFIQANKVAIFIKGEPDAPRTSTDICFFLFLICLCSGCGFSNAVLQILNLHGCEFKSKNILEDEQLRQTMKAYRYVQIMLLINFCDAAFV